MIGRVKERLQMWVAWNLPDWLMYWAIVRATSIASGTVYLNRSPMDLKVSEVLELILGRMKPKSEKSEKSG